MVIRSYKKVLLFTPKYGKRSDSNKYYPMFYVSESN